MPTKTTRVLNCKPSPQPEKDWRVEHAIQAGLASRASAELLPATRDLRDAWWPIADQADTGSCVGWAAADSVLRWHFVAAGRIAPHETLSPRFLWMAAKETDELASHPTTFVEHEGTSLKAALDIARRYGLVRDELLPFASGRLYGGSAMTFYAQAAQLRIAAYFNLGRDLADWKIWLAQQGPILTRLDVDRGWLDVPASGCLDRYDAARAGGGHAIALVGYDHDAFIVRNSWGTDWGDGGYAYASPAYAAAAFTEAYGVRLV